MREILKNRIYKHFKGDYYLVLDFALNNEDDKNYVIYKALYGNGQLFIRPYEDFAGKVNIDKYPNHIQEFKFELQNIESLNNTHKEGR